MLHDTNGRGTHLLSKRSYLKAMGSTMAIGSIAGCLGDRQDGATTGTPSPDELSVEEERALGSEEWRTLASEEAASELQETTLKLYGSRERSEEFIEQILRRDFQGVYEPLTGNIETVVTGSGSSNEQRYARLMAAQRPGHDIMTSRPYELIADGVPFTDLTVIPSYREMDDNLKVPPYVGPLRVNAYGLPYNTEVIEDAGLATPTNWDDLLEYPGELMGVDYTPAASAVGWLTEKKGVEYMEDIGAKKLNLFDSSRTFMRNLISGNLGAAILGSNTLTWDAIAEGQPVEAVRDPNAWSWYIRPYVMSAIPETPWAAKLFLDFHWSTPESQLLQRGSVSFDFQRGYPQELLETFPVDEDKKVWGPYDFDRTPTEIILQYQEWVGAPTA